jgi:hypothetical protein
MSPHTKASAADDARRGCGTTPAPGPLPPVPRQDAPGSIAGPRWAMGGTTTEATRRRSARRQELPGGRDFGAWPDHAPQRRVVDVGCSAASPQPCAGSLSGDRIGTLEAFPRRHRSASLLPTKRPPSFLGGRFSATSTGSAVDEGEQLNANNIDHPMQEAVVLIPGHDPSHHT